MGACNQCQYQGTEATSSLRTDTRNLLFGASNDCMISILGYLNMKSI